MQWIARFVSENGDGEWTRDLPIEADDYSEAERIAQALARDGETLVEVAPWVP